MVRFMDLRSPVHVNGGRAARWSREGMVRAAFPRYRRALFLGI